MKYLKYFENSIKYKAGDYVLVPKWNYPYNYVYIKLNNYSEIPYLGVWSIKNENDFNIWLKDNDIERLLTPEEIEIYKELKTTYKFNI